MSSMRLWALLSVILGGCAHARTAAPTGAPDAILVLGHKPPLRSGVIESELRARVEHGIALFRAGRAPLLVMSGGESTPGVIEADVMAQWATVKGVPAEAIVRERTSRNTVENARFAVALLTSRLGRTPRLLLVTSDYHGARAARLVDCAGAEVELSLADPLLSERERRRRARSERWINLYYGFIDECARAAGR